MDELQRIAEDLAARLGRAVAIDDARMNLLAHTAHDDRIDEHRVASILQLRASDAAVEHALAQGIAQACGPVRVPARPDIALLARVCIPVRCQDLLLGYLWLIDDDGALTETELARASAAATAAGESLYRTRLLGDLRDSRSRELLRDLLSGEPRLRRAAATSLVEEDLLPGGAAVTVVSVHLTGPVTGPGRTALDAALARAARRAAPLQGLSLSRSDGTGLLVLGGRPTSATAVRAPAEELAADLASTLDKDVGVRVGLGTTVAGVEAAHVSAEQARAAVEVAAVVPGFGTVTSWDELGVYRILVRLPLDELGDDLLPEGLRQLMAADRSGVLVTTLEAWLDEGGDARVTAERLQVHRTSLYYRIGRVEQLTGMSLSNGGDRLALHLGLKLARLQPASTRAEPQRGA